MLCRLLSFFFAKMTGLVRVWVWGVGGLGFFGFGFGETHFCGTFDAALIPVALEESHDEMVFVFFDS